MKKIFISYCRSEDDSPKKLIKHTKRFFAPLHSALNDGKHGFTLAEVLITLTIIGVIAALTIPTLMQKHQEQVTITQLKKTYSVLSNAYNLIIKEDGTLDTWLKDENTNAQNAEIVFNKFKPYLKISKDCGFNSGCLPSGPPKNLNGTNYSVSYDTYPHEYRVILDDGVVLMFYANPSGSNIKVKLNGTKGPYTWGKDFFLFTYGDGQTFPYAKHEVLRPHVIGSDFSANCSKLHSSSLGCAAWLIYKGNMDYLHCSDLTWNGKNKCSK